MGMSKKEFLGCKDPIECFITQSSFRIPSGKTGVPAWLDAGDILSINTDNQKEEINFISISRPDDKHLKPIEFQFSENSISEINQISSHLVFLARSGLKLQEMPEKSYRLEAIVQCHCGSDPGSSKKKLSYFFYEESTNEDTCTHAGNVGGSGDGGGWSAK